MRMKPLLSIYQAVNVPNDIYMAMHGNVRPEAFRRPTNTVPINAEDPIGKEANML
jgi:hypothetical protein